MKKNVIAITMLIIVVVGIIVLFNYQTVSAAETRVVLFPVTGKWYICQGYNTSAISHKGEDIYGLDFSPDINSFSGGAGYGCNAATRNAATGKKIYAPAAGVIHYYRSPDIIQLKLTTGGCMKIAHLASAVIKEGATVKQGQLIGTLAAPNSLNGNYAHLHISAYSDKTCKTPVPFTSSKSFRLYGAKEFPATGIPKEHRGNSIIQSVPPMGLDLSGYCKSKGFVGVVLNGQTVYSWKCKTSSGTLSGISDMAAVCKWQYKGLVDVAKFTNENDPYSWKCYTK